MDIPHKDSQLVNRLILRDEKALYELYASYQKLLYNFIYKRLKDPNVSDELVQDIFIEFLESLRDFRYQCSLKTFIFTITRNKMIDYMRRKKIKGIVFSSLPESLVEHLTVVKMDGLLEKQEIEAHLEKTLSSLPHEYQVILRLKYMEDKSVKYISETLVKTLKATESLLFRARRAFIKLYGPISI